MATIGAARRVASEVPFRRTATACSATSYPLVMCAAGAFCRNHWRNALRSATSRARWFFTAALEKFTFWPLAGLVEALVIRGSAPLNCTSALVRSVRCTLVACGPSAAEPVAAVAATGPASIAHASGSIAAMNTHQ